MSDSETAPPGIDFNTFILSLSTSVSTTRGVPVLRFSFWMTWNSRVEFSRIMSRIWAMYFLLKAGTRFCLTHM